MLWGYVIGFSVFTGIPGNIVALTFLLLGYGAIVANNFFSWCFLCCCTVFKYIIFIYKCVTDIPQLRFHVVKRPVLMYEMARFILQNGLF